VWLCCEEYECAISGPLLDVALGQGRSPGRLLLDGLPRPTRAGFTVFAVWYAAQAALALSVGDLARPTPPVVRQPRR